MMYIIIIPLALAVGISFGKHVARYRASLPRSGQWWVSKDDPYLYALVYSFHAGLVEFDLYEQGDIEPVNTQFLYVDLFMHNYMRMR